MVDVPNTTAQSTIDTWSSIGWLASFAGTGLAAVNAWYQVDAQKHALEAQALALDFQQSQAALAREQAESDYQATIAAGQSEKAALTLRQGQERASLVAGQAASGTGPGGSNAEIRATQRLMARIDAMTLDSNTLRAANAAKMRGVNASNESLLAGVSAANVRGTARGLDPYLATGASLLGNAGTISSQWVYRGSRSRRY